MNNKFINYHGETLQNTKNKKTKVEIQIEELKKQKQAIITELWSWEIKQKQAEQLIDYLDEVNQFSTKYLTEAVEKAKREKKRGLEQLIKNKVEFGLKFGSVKQAFCKLIFRKTESQVKHLKSQLGTIQRQLSHQERIFARIEIRRQGHKLLTCEYKKSLGCLSAYQCDNCKVNYFVADNQSIEISQ